MVAATAKAPGQKWAGRAQGATPVAVGLAVIAVSFAIAFFPTIKWMAGEWSGSSGVLSHGYLVVAISIALFVRAVPDVAEAGTEPAWWLLSVLLVLSLVWLLGFVSTVIAIQEATLPAILLVALACALGLKAARPLAFPVLFFYFAIPAWEHLQFIFQAITVAIVGLLVRAADIPALLEGNFVHLASGSFEIAGGCAGLAFVISGLSLAVLYGHLYYDNARQKILLIAVTLGVAMLGNWIRVFAIITIGYRTDMQSSLVDDHLTVGWVLFAFLMMPVYRFATRLEDSDHNSLDKDQVRPVKVVALNWIALSFVVGAMLAGPLWARAAVTGLDNAPDDIQLKLPDSTYPWSGPVASQWDWEPIFTGADAERLVQYNNGEDIVLVYVNLYLYQQQDKELVYFSNSVSGRWRTATLDQPMDSTVVLDSGDTYRQDSAGNYVGDWVFWSRYDVAGRFETSDVRIKLQQALSTLRGQPQSGVIVFATPCKGSCNGAAKTMAAFANHIGSDIRIHYTRVDL